MFPCQMPDDYCEICGQRGSSICRLAERDNKSEKEEEELRQVLGRIGENSASQDGA